jgi:hypothetical protein
MLGLYCDDLSDGGWDLFVDGSGDTALANLWTDVHAIGRNKLNVFDATKTKDSPPLAIRRETSPFLLY